MKSEKAQRIYRVVMLIVLTALITFMVTTVGLYNIVGKERVRYITTAGDTSTIGKTLQSFKDFIEEKYIGSIDEDEMTQGAIKGYVEGLIYSRFKR